MNKETQGPPPGALHHIGPGCVSYLSGRRLLIVDDDGTETSLRHAYGSLSDEVTAEAHTKYLPLPQQETAWRFIREHWQAIWEALDGILPRIRDVLLAAGAPTTIREVGISAEELRTALLWARHMRGRYTVLDFASALGVLEELCEPVLIDSGVLN